MVTRRTLLLGGFATACILPSRSIAKALYEGVPLGEAPGDYGYKHDQYHDLYQEIFGRILGCSCGAGDCRVTEYRPTILGSPLGYDVVAYRQ